jgi:uncharacterized membrane protein
MLQPDARPHVGPLSSRAGWALGLGLMVLVVGTWLAFTPPGLLGKADATGYAICHRIDLRSFHIGDRPMPLCARCTGIYLGALFGLLALGLMGHRRTGGLPTGPMLVVLISFIAVMGIDGVNSYATLFPGLPHLYEPQNWLRLATGTFNGLAVSALIYPVFNQTLWQVWVDRPILSKSRELALLVGLSLMLIALVLTDDPVVLYPLALLSALGVLALLTMLYTVAVLILSRRHNTAQTWRDAVLPVVVGFTLAVFQIGVIDAARFAIFQTWNGFPFPR